MGKKDKKAGSFEMNLNPMKNYYNLSYHISHKQNQEAK